MADSVVMPEFLIDSQSGIWEYAPAEGPNKYEEVTGGDFSSGIQTVGWIRERFGPLQVLKREDWFTG